MSERKTKPLKPVIVCVDGEVRDADIPKLEKAGYIVIVVANKDAIQIMPCVREHMGVVFKAAMQTIAQDNSYCGPAAKFGATLAKALSQQEQDKP